MTQMVKLDWIERENLYQEVKRLLTKVEHSRKGLIREIIKFLKIKETLMITVRKRFTQSTLKENSSLIVRVSIFLSMKEILVESLDSIKMDIP